MTSETLTIKQYIELNQTEKINYIKTRFHLKDNYLVASVNRQHLGQNFFFANQLMNPYTGEKITEALFSDLPESYHAFCPNFNLEKNDIEPHDLILFSFTPNIDIPNLEKGSIVIIDRNSIMKVEDSSQILAEYKVSNHELLEMQPHTSFDKIGYVSDLYRKNVKAIIDNRAENILKLTKELEEKAAELEKEDAKLTEREQTLLGEQLKFDEHVANRNDKHNKKIERCYKKLAEKSQAVYAELNEVNERVIELGFPPFKGIGQIAIEETDEANEAEQFAPLPESPKDIVDAIHEQLKQGGLDYDNATIRQFYSALKANQFTILSGSSGTGKTSLISAFADLTSSVAKVIPVQPSWTDKQDLLGYYNPLDKQYVPSQLLDALIDAKENADKLYLICLDELNLAQIEYYFADILSLREQTDVPLELYSQYEYEQNIAEISWFVENAVRKQGGNPEAELAKLIEEKLNVATIDQFRYVQRYNNLQRYNWSMHIPENVRFIGTMNIDGSVRPLSPKVVDRSFIIPLERQEYDGKVTEEALMFNLTYEAFSKVPNRDANNEIKVTLQHELSDDLQALEADFNTRVDKHLDDYIAIAQSLAVEDDTIFDELILLKLLPRINKLIDHDEDTLENFKQKITSLTGENSKSLQTIEKMMKKAEQTKIFSYWS